MKIKKHNLFIPLFFIFLFLSCAQNVPKLESTRKSVIFEYESEDAFPIARLSFFVETDKNVRRADKILLKNEETQYIWELEDLILFESVDRFYCGITNIQAPMGEKIPSGKYIANYVQLDGQENQISSFLKYDDKLYSMNYKEALEFFNDLILIKKIAIFDENNVLIHYGEKESKFETVRGIWNEYNNANYFYDVVFIKGNDVILILPRQNVELEKSLNED